jgi:tRNA threonylcarbamoyl adenosine modification protein YeaZ
MPAIVETLAELSLNPQDLTHVAVALGPGGFSAVRVGISATLGLTVSKQLPVLGIPTHEIEAFRYISSASAEPPVYSLIPAGRNEIAWARHTGGSETTTGVLAPDELVASVEPEAIFCGEACDLITDLVDSSRIREHEPPTRDPSSILDIAVNKFSAGISTPYEELRPIYARPPSISKPKPPKSANSAGSPPNSTAISKNFTAQ